MHLNGSFFVSRAAAEHYRKQESGAFVHITSTSGLIGNFGQANYSAAKLGITALSKSIALDMQRYNVRSNCIAPFAWSRMTSRSRRARPSSRRGWPRSRQMTPDKNAPMAVFLSSDAAKDVTGQVFGTRMQRDLSCSARRGRSASCTTPMAGRRRRSPSTRCRRCKAAFMPLDRSGEVFGWDPV